LNDHIDHDRDHNYVRPLTLFTSAAGDDKPLTDWLSFELSHEDVTDHAGNVDDENVAGDSGGKTFAGIDQALHPHFPYSNPTPVDVVAEYRVDWNRVQAHSLPAPVEATVANFGVNMGTEPAVKLLQKALNVVVGGSIGPATLLAASKLDGLNSL
jgi:lysozyme family protein